MSSARQGTLGNGKIKVLKYQFEVTSPRVPATVAPAGRTITGPVSITKGWDAATVPLLQALETNESLPLVTIEFVGTSPQTGVDKLLFTVKLRNASVASINQTVDTATPSGALEEVRFTYQGFEVQDDTTRAIAASSPTAR